ncbi:3-phenylpropionic acid transporter [Haemophilus paracuniculus]|uniref:3-phenylpropionic acid transporter n=1 Tax=Haemophilus paracuniculus TaxID=734 RepID=A0A1T0AU34_9PAST|nr:3-phenylpropionate MFS transporter [Haemophilus paracuniculus]OOS00252.1 3-phenylpropionic acid transporter [Haemophilus paracuniculus]
MIKLTPFQWSSFNFFGFFCAYGVLLPFFPVWLSQQGYSTETISLLIALGYLFRFFGGMLLSQRIKDSAQLIPFTRFLAWFTIAILLGVMWAGGQFWLLLPILGLFHIINGGAMPINETIASTWQREVGMDYGKARLFGSVAFVVGSISTGYLVSWLGEQAIVWIMASFTLLLASGLMLPVNHRFAPSQTKASDTAQLSYWEIFKDPTACRMLLAVSFVQAGHAAYYAYSTLHWQAAGISTQTSSLLWGAAVVAEIGLFFFATRLFTNIRIYQLVLIGTLGAMIRWAIMASTTNVAILLFAQLLHALSFGMTHYAMIRYIATQEANKIAKLQGLYFGLASCGVMALFTLFAGIAYNISAETSFWLMVVLVVPAIFLTPKVVASKISSQ